MYVKSIKMHGLRGINEGEINELNEINIFIGRNNMGKSIVLEALYLASTLPRYDYFDIFPLSYTLYRRGWTGLNSVHNLFYKSSDTIIIEITLADKHVQALSLKKRYCIKRGCTSTKFKERF